jgi:hypothetical protein
MARVSLAAPLFLAALFSAALPAAALAHNSGAAVCILPDGIRAPYAAVAEADSGALVIYEDTRGNGVALYSQRVDHRGHPMLAAGGVLVRSFSAFPYLDGFLPDGSGGIILAWDEVRGTAGHDVILQRVLADGTLAYGPNGIDICSANLDQGEAQLAAGPSGSYYVVWKDMRNNNASDADIYAQRVSLAGSAMWTANGVAVNAPADINAGGYGNGGLPYICDDALGGLVVSWVPDATRIPKAQHLNSAGAATWASGIAFGAYSDTDPIPTPDGSGGAWIAFRKYNGSSGYIPYFQHVLPAGTLQFTAAGVNLNMGNSVGTNFSMVPFRNGSGGCFFYVVGYINSNGSYAYRQEVNSAGTLLRGTGESLNDNYLSNVQFQNMGTSLLLVYTQNFGSGRVKLAVQRYDNTGAALYPGQGVIVGRDEPLALAGAGIANVLGNVAIIPFADSRYSNPTQIVYQVFGQALDAAGNPIWDDAELPAVQSALDAPQDQGGNVRVDWNAGAADFPGAGAVTGYRVWRNVPGTIASQAARVQPVTHEGQFQLGGRTLLAHANAYWEQVGEQSAAQLAGYALTVPTGQDSMAGSPATEYFMVEAYDDSSHIWWSGIASGHSVDNLAPPPLTSAAGYYGSGSTTLYWGGSSAADLCCYDVFAGSGPGFVANDASRIGTTTDVTFSASGPPQWFRIGARDIHGNLGGTVLVQPSGAAGVDGPVAPTEWRLQAHWQRGTQVLALALDVPTVASGAVELFDVAGRRLWSQPFHAGVASTLAIGVDSRDAHLPAGVVFARATSTEGKMLVARAIVLK